MKAHRWLFPLLALALAAGCVTAAERFEQGVELEERGRPADAAERYIDALRKDPSLADARRRLQDAGDRAAADYLERAGAADAA
ncbi:MAG TPA: hypothetical protein VFX98_18820, partial [Longimicrobiaceae bacterium]|nr:hypothetical protein [Longimicrobiaceae bacterium]